jgi:2-polyprenyl-3-methyl-5-hydroxy-6-metoxy-1,4-benzoquinol methylase
VRENEIVASGYDDIAEAYLEWTIRSPSRERWLNELAGILPQRGDVLDLGCGAGMVARRLTEVGFCVLGIDGSSRQIALACKNEPRAEFRLADMVSVSFPIASFAAVTAFYSITHVPRAAHAALFKRIAEWLKPGGIWLASLGCRDCPDWTGEWLGTTMFFSHFDAETNIGLVEKAGLTIRHARSSAKRKTEDWRNSSGSSRRNPRRVFDAGQPLNWARKVEAARRCQSPANAKLSQQAKRSE